MKGYPETEPQSYLKGDGQLSEMRREEMLPLPFCRIGMEVVTTLELGTLHFQMLGTSTRCPQQCLGGPKPLDSTLATVGQQQLFFRTSTGVPSVPVPVPVPEPVLLTMHLDGQSSSHHYSYILYLSCIMICSHYNPCPKYATSYKDDLTSPP